MLAKLEIRIMFEISLRLSRQNTSECNAAQQLFELPTKRTLETTKRIARQLNGANEEGQKRQRNRNVLDNIKASKDQRK